MASHAESPAPGPVMHARQLSASSNPPLSSSGRATGTATGGGAGARPHFVTKHSRTASHAKTLHKLGRTQSAVNVHGHAPNHAHTLESRNQPQHQQHQRKKSGQTLQPSVTPVDTAHESLQSQPDPTTAAANRQTSMKKNTSHVHLPKNKSHTQLRKNKSASTLAALARNTSHGALNRLGTAQNKLGAPPKQRKSRELDERERNKAVFELEGNSDDEDAGDHDGDEAEEAEWEDSTTLSPELTRNNSRVNTPQDTPSSSARSRPAPTSAPAQQRPDASDSPLPENTSSPPTPSLPRNDRSAPNLRNKAVADPALLYQHGRASRAPPAMTTTMAHARTGLLRNESSASLARLRDGVSENSSVSERERQPPLATKTAQVVRQPLIADSTSSTSAGVSHFLPTSDPSISPSSRPTSHPSSSQPILTMPSTISNSDPDSAPDSSSDSEASADEETRSFLANYRPLPSHANTNTKSQSQSSDTPRAMLNKTRVSSLASRTQQKLDLARRESMRGNPPISTHNSLLSLHSSRTNSRLKPGAATGLVTQHPLLDAQRSHDTAIRQLMVVRRFRNPVLESLGRMYQDGKLGTNVAMAVSTSTSTTNMPRVSRPPSRRSQHHNHDNTTTTPIPAAKLVPATTQPSTAIKTSMSTSPTLPRSSNLPSRASTSKVQFQFQLSRHDSDDTSTGTSPESVRSRSAATATKRALQSDISDEEALIRRMWTGRSSNTPPAPRNSERTHRSNNNSNNGNDDEAENDGEAEAENDSDRDEQVHIKINQQQQTPALPGRNTRRARV